MKKTIRCSKCGDKKESPESVFDMILAIDRNDSALYLSTLIKKYFSP